VLESSMLNNLRVASEDNDEALADISGVPSDHKREVEIDQMEIAELQRLAQQDIEETMKLAFLGATPGERLARSSIGQGAVTLEDLIAVLAGRVIDCDARAADLSCLAGAVTV